MNVSTSFEYYHPYPVMMLKNKESESFLKYKVKNNFVVKMFKEK